MYAMLRRTVLVLGLFLTAASALSAQSGPWARYDGKMKGEALIRDADGGYLGEVKSIVQGGEGAQQRDWTFRNETNATEENIRNIETARLSSPNVMSISAKRPIPGR